MATYQERFDAAAEDTYNRSSVEPTFREEYPTLADVFSGITSRDPNQKDIPCATINLFWEGGRLKFCIIPRGLPKIAFGCLAEPEKGFAALEWALANGAFEWKRKTAR
jgi:hypothetical protein